MKESEFLGKLEEILDNTGHDDDPFQRLTDICDKMATEVGNEIKKLDVPTREFRQFLREADAEKKSP